MTVNKAQGQTFEHVGLDLRTTAFAHGQLYVALSRVKMVSGLQVLWRPDQVPETENIVYPEVLLY